jgi:hypothetical protein
MHRRTAALAGSVILAAAMAVTGAVTAHATTPTCTAGQVPVGADPISCGGLFFPQLGAFGTPPSGTPLTLTLQTPQWNGHVIDEPYSSGNKAQDETVWEVCNGFNPAGRTEANPCGTGFTPTLNPDTNLPLFVPEFTPLGKHLGGAINTPGNLCLSVEGVHNGPHHALRWRLVARTCDTFGAVFFAGLPDGGPGVTGVVVHPNPWQTWTAVGPVNGAGNFVFANDALSRHFLNRLWVVDVPGAGLAPGQWLLAFPENDRRNQTGEIAGCNGAAAVITPGDTDCP